eukprot:290981-Rhodomonas_salina.2
MIAVMRREREREEEQGLWVSVGCEGRVAEERRGAGGGEDSCQCGGRGSGRESKSRPGEGGRRGAIKTGEREREREREARDARDARRESRRGQDALRGRRVQVRGEMAARARRRDAVRCCAWLSGRGLLCGDDAGVLRGVDNVRGDRGHAARGAARHDLPRPGHAHPVGPRRQLPRGDPQRVGGHQVPPPYAPRAPSRCRSCSQQLCCAAMPKSGLLPFASLSLHSH